MEFLIKVIQLILLSRIFIILLPLIIEHSWFEYPLYFKNRNRHKWLEKTDLTRLVILLTSMFLSNELPKPEGILNMTGLVVSLISICLFLIITWNKYKIDTFFKGKYINRRLKSSIYHDKKITASIFDHLIYKNHLNASLCNFQKLQVNQKLESNEKLIWTSVSKRKDKNNKQSLLNLLAFLFPKASYDFLVIVAEENFLDANETPFKYTAKDFERYMNNSSKELLNELSKIA